MTQAKDLGHIPEPDLNNDSATATPEVDTIAGVEPDPATEATDILDAENKGLNDPEDATAEHGDITPDGEEDDPDEFDEEDEGEGEGDIENDDFSGADTTPAESTEPNELTDEVTSDSPDLFA